jgi:hypothetical protein
MSAPDDSEALDELGTRFQFAGPPFGVNALCTPSALQAILQANYNPKQHRYRKSHLCAVRVRIPANPRFDFGKSLQQLLVEASKRRGISIC